MQCFGRMGIMTRKDLTEWYDHARECSTCRYQVKKIRKQIFDHVTELKIEPTRTNLIIHVRQCNKCFSQSVRMGLLICWFYFKLKVKKFLKHFKFWY